MMRKEASSFRDHLAELRKCLMRELAVLVVTGGAGLALAPRALGVNRCIHCPTEIMVRTLRCIYSPPLLS
jgi:hypothetical protein